jgi:hypothetical protein
MGDAASRLRWSRINGLSSEVNASMDDRLIQIIRFEMRAAFGRLFV